jgi:hypothetical protein
MQDNLRFREIAKIIRTEEDRIALRTHLKQIVEGEAFKGSRRCAQFLQYVVERSLGEDLDALKERTIGIELFGRSPTYDTSEDAIVRVTASDVRRRLLQHYGRSGNDSEFRIALPAGGYILEIQRDQKTARAEDHGESNPPKTFSPTPAEEHIDLPKIAPMPPVGVSFPKQFAIALAVIVPFILWSWHIPVLARANQTHELSPWSTIFRSPHPAQVIASDPDIADIQTIADKQISLSAYANENYGCDLLATDLKTACQSELRGDKVAAVDAEVIARIAVLAERKQGAIVVRSARATRLKDLRTDDNYVLLGSPRSNPWVGLFTDQMEYQIVYDPIQRQEIVRNKRPNPSESDRYIPTAMGFGTGQSFATISLLRNHDQNGRVFLLAGTIAESTEAASEFAMNAALLDSTLRNCGVTSSPASSFQILLRVETMAGSATRTDVVGCHRLPTPGSS